MAEVIQKRENPETKCTEYYVHYKDCEYSVHVCVCVCVCMCVVCVYMCVWVYGTVDVSVGAVHVSGVMCMMDVCECERYVWM